MKSYTREQIRRACVLISVTALLLSGAATAGAGAEEEPPAVSMDDVDVIGERALDMRVSMLSEDESNGLCRRELMLDDIPLLEIYRDDGAIKPLLIFLHGLGGKKEGVADALAVFAAAGYHAVSVDAFGQGMRSAAACDNWAAVLLTAGDIDRVVAYYRTVPGVDAENFVLGGFSMGGIESCAYVRQGGYTPSALLSVCAVCELDAWRAEPRSKLAWSWFLCEEGRARPYYAEQEADYTERKLDAITALNISGDPAAYRDIPILFCIGTEDRYFRAEGAEAAAELLREAGNGHVSCVVYPGMPHRLAPEMLEACLDFLNGLAQ